MKKKPKQLERHFKGVANHRRIQILAAVAAHGGITVDEIASLVSCNFKTASQHTLKLVQAGLLDKKYHGRQVMHALSPYGRTMFRILETF